MLPSPIAGSSIIIVPTREITSRLERIVPDSSGRWTCNTARALRARQYAAMRAATSTMNPFIAAPAKGRVISSTMNTATILGTKTSVCSWICVSAWSRPMPRPTTRAVSMAGVMTSSRTRIEERAKSMESAGVMCSSDRHVHDGLVGLHDLVADGHDGIERDFRLVHGTDDVDDVGLAGDLASRPHLAELHRAG